MSKNKVVSKIMILCWAAFTAILGLELDTLAEGKGDN